MPFNVDVRSPYFPYVKVQESYYDLSDSVSLPRKIADYLIDAPQGDYIPPDDNSFPRCRLWKYLYHDGPRPLEQPLPNINEKMSVVFNPDDPQNPPTEKGYRLIPQIFTRQSQEKAQTRLNVYMGRTVPMNEEMRIALAVTFRIWTHYIYELNTRSDEYSRAFAIEQCLIEALHGVNMNGIGTFFFSKMVHPDCGSGVMYDGETNVGRELTIALQVATVAPNDFGSFVNRPMANESGTVRWGW
jgi:hypothetical protein